MSSLPDYYFCHPESERNSVHPLFARNGIVVTRRWLWVHGKRYDVAELHAIGRSRGAANPAVPVALGVGVVDAVVLLPLAVLAHTMIGATSAVLAFVLAGVAAAIFGRRSPREQAIRATYRGSPVTLYESRDPREFGQVSRAILRASEAVPHELP